MVRQFQHDTEHVLVNEEIASRELEVVQEADQVEEEGVAAYAREELVRSLFCDQRLAAERHRSLGNDHISAVFINVRLIPNGAAHGCPLLPIDDGRERNTKRDLGERIRVRVDLQLIQAIVLKLICEGGSKWIDIQDENG